MNLLFASKGLANAALTDYFTEWVGTSKRIAIITTAAAVYKQKNRNNVTLAGRLRALGYAPQFIDIEFTDPKILPQFAAVVINGGNPYYLLHHVKRSGADAVLKEMISSDIPVMGISAGLLIFLKSIAIIDWLTPEMNTIELADKSGLGVVDEIILPHYDRFVQEGKIQQSAINDFEESTKNEVIGLGEFQYLHYEGEGRKVIGGLLE